jgi:hypothetical protein
MVRRGFAPIGMCGMQFVGDHKPLVGLRTESRLRCPYRIDIECRIVPEWRTGLGQQSCCVAEPVCEYQFERMRIPSAGRCRRDDSNSGQ